MLSHTIDSYSAAEANLMQLLPISVPEIHKFCKRLSKSLAAHYLLLHQLIDKGTRLQPLLQQQLLRDMVDRVREGHDTADVDLIDTSSWRTRLLYPS